MKLNAEQYIELSNIGTSNIFVENDNTLKLSWEGVTKIIKSYDKMKRLNNAAISKTIAKWDEELKKEYERIGIEHKPYPHFGQRDNNGDTIKYWGGLAKEVSFDEINNQSINHPEILDEEIQKQAIKYAYHIPYENPLSDFMQGAKWYRQQLKQK